MALEKLSEALRDLQRQRSVLDGAIQHLEQAILAMSGMVAEAPKDVARFEIAGMDSQSIPPYNGENHKVRDGSYFEDSLAVLTKIAAPLHIVELHKYVESKTGKTLTRASLEGAITRHMRSRGEKSLIVRVGPSKYALRRNVEHSISL